MFIKLDIQGELLDKLKEESETQFRSCTQQVMYIITKYYKDKENNVFNNTYNTYNNEVASNVSNNIHIQNTENIPNQEPPMATEKVSAPQETTTFEDNIDDDIVNF